MVAGHPAGGTKRVRSADGRYYACRSKPLASKYSYRDPAIYDDYLFGGREAGTQRTKHMRGWRRKANRYSLGFPRNRGASGDEIFWDFEKGSIRDVPRRTGSRMLGFGARWPREIKPKTEKKKRKRRKR